MMIQVIVNAMSGLSKNLRFTLFILLNISFINLYAIEDNRIISYELWQTVSKDELNERMRQRKIPKALLDPKYDVHIYDVTYLSCWHDGSEVVVSGLYFVPQQVEKDLPVLVYHHGTKMVKGREDEIKKETNLALGYAVDGYAVLMPDYFGLGHGERFHIYQLYKPLAQTTIDFLFAMEQLNHTLKVRTNGQLFLTGYSEGGYAALATNKLIQEKYSNHFKVTATAANAGAYDMLGVQSHAMFKPYHRPQFLPYLLMGINEVYNIVPDVLAMYKPPYDSLVNYYFDGYHSHDELTELFPKIPIEMLHDTFVNLYLNDKDWIFHRAIEENTISNWKPENPVQFCHCKGDETVFYENSVVTRNNMLQLGAEDITLINPGKKYNHRSCGLFATSYSKFYLDSFREDSKNGRNGSLIQRFFLAIAKLKKPVVG
jgi:hypothetical protein